jgi:PAS domain S-box-containing protein
VAIFVNRNDRLVLVNQACLTLFGATSEEELLGKSPLELFHPDDLQAIRDRIHRQRDLAEPVPARDERIVRLDGGVVDVEVSASPFVDGDTVSIHVVLRDISERKGAEAALREFADALEERVAERTQDLREANTELEAFAYSVSHDLRAPLRAASGFAEILARKYADQLDVQGRHFIDNIVVSSRQMGRLIDDLLAYSRLGRRAIRREPVELGPIVDRLRVTYADRLAGPGTRLMAQEPLETPVGDPTLIDQVLANFVGNALTYCRPGVPPEVRIAACPDRGGVTLRVSDNGIGIEAEHLERIFEVFTRLHADEDYAGTGIGLAIARKAARLMDGEISVESTVGVGSTFSLHLPHGIQTDEDDA